MILDRVSADSFELTDPDGFTKDGLHLECGHFHAEYTVCPNEDDEDDVPCGDYRCCIN